MLDTGLVEGDSMATEELSPDDEAGGHGAHLVLCLYKEHLWHKTGLEFAVNTLRQCGQDTGA